MIRRALLVVAASLLVSAGLAAQSQKTPLKPIKTLVAFDTDTKVGGTVLKAGEYSLVAEGDHLTFQSLVQNETPGDWKPSKDKPVVVTATRKALPKKIENTEMLVPVQQGVHVLTQIQIGGTDVEYDFN